jgi:hypothetical protein
MRWTITVIVVLVLAAGLWWLEQERQTDLHRSVDPPAPVEREEEPRYPLPRTEPEPDRSTPPPPSAVSDEAEPSAVDAEPAQPVTPLPPLTESDSRALEALSGLIGPEFVRQWIRPEFVIPRTVALINSLDGPAPAMRIRPLRTLDAEPAAALPEDSDDRSWTAEDVQRYDALVDTLDSVSPERAAATYARYYPLLQQAWEDLGEDEPHFNDRLIDIVDHLLAAPEVAIPFAVTAYEGRLIFAEDALESRSWGQKALIRLGPEHADRVKTWLRAFRLALVGGDDASEAPIDDGR